MPIIELGGPTASYIERDHFSPSQGELFVLPGFCCVRPDVDITQPHFYEDPNNWLRNKYQTPEEITLILNMIRIGLTYLRDNPHAIVCSSGGFTNPLAGEDISEASSYLAVARQMIVDRSEEFGEVDLQRWILDESSYNSNQNLWGALSAYHTQFNTLPRYTTFLAYDLKCERMNLVAGALGLTSVEFSCQIVDGPTFNDSDRERERAILEQMRSDILITQPRSKHYQTTIERNWANMPVNLINVSEIRKLYWERRTGRPLRRLPTSKRQSSLPLTYMNYAAD